VTITADIDVGMRHRVGQVGRVRRCTWRAGVLMCEVVLPPPEPLPRVHRNGHMSWPQLRAIDRIQTALWVLSGALEAPPPSFGPPEEVNAHGGGADAIDASCSAATNMPTGSQPTFQDLSMPCRRRSPGSSCRH
jgi:hypothetical protein